MTCCLCRVGSDEKCIIAPSTLRYFFHESEKGVCSSFKKLEKKRKKWRGVLPFEESRPMKMHRLWSPLSDFILFYKALSICFQRMKDKKETSGETCCLRRVRRFEFEFEFDRINMDHLSSRLSEVSWLRPLIIIFFERLTNKPETRVAREKERDIAQDNFKV